MLRVIAMGVLCLVGCAAESAARREDQQSDNPPLPDWTKKAHVPEIAVRCAYDEYTARTMAETAARASIVDHYCGSTNVTPERRESVGSLFMSMPKRTAKQHLQGQTCVYVEMNWGAVMCETEAGPPKVIENPALK